jgi:uncharacterized membrane protein YkoI
MRIATLFAAATLFALGAHSAEGQDTTHHAKAARKSATKTSLKAQARITEDSARVIALSGLPNGSKVRESELEREKGTIVWSFDIKVPGKAGVEEVLVSALDAHVVDRSHESAKKEAAEAVADRKQAAKKP